MESGSASQSVSQPVIVSSSLLLQMSDSCLPVHLACGTASQPRLSVCLSAGLSRGQQVCMHVRNFCPPLDVCLSAKKKKRKIKNSSSLHFPFHQWRMNEQKPKRRRRRDHQTERERRRKKTKLINQRKRQKLQQS